jgi:hypothetical protein
MSALRFFGRSGTLVIRGFIEEMFKLLYIERCIFRVQACHF